MEEPAVPDRGAAPTNAVEPSQSDAFNWSTTGSMIYGRMLHTSTLLPDGKVLTVGGFNRLAEVYAPETGTWSRTADSINTFRSATATRLFDGRVLVAGAGGAEWNSGISAALYDSATASWRATGNMVKPRFHHTATLLQDGRVLVTGGADSEYGGTTLASAEVYDPRMGTWTRTGPMATARRDHTATLLRDGKVLVTGGSDGGGALLRTAEVYDPVTGTWCSAGTMAVARAYHTATALPDGRVLIVGGGDFEWAHGASAELFHPATRAWTVAASMSKPRRKHTATLLPSGLVLVAGGFHEYTGILRAAEAYEPASGTWLPAGQMEADRYQHTATLLAHGTLLVTGGFSNTNQASAELLFPYSQSVLETGPHWQLLHVSGVAGEAGQPYSENLFVLEPAGIDEAPLPEGLRADLAAATTSPDSTFILNKWVVDELRISERQGALTPALEAIAEPLDEGRSAEGLGPRQVFGECSEQVQVVSRSLSVSQSIPLVNLNLADRVTGTVNGTAYGTISAEVRVTKRRYALFWKCIPYAVRFDSASLRGNLTVASTMTLNGTLSGSSETEFELINPQLFSIDFFAGIVPVHIPFTLPITVGARLEANTTGSVSLNVSQSSAGIFDYGCTGGGCGGNAHYSQTSTSAAPTATGGISGHLKPSVYVQAALRTSLYAKGVAYVQVGVRPVFLGDLWGYAGNTCGDADGDGVPETVRALTFDFDRQVRITAETATFATARRRWDDLWHTPLVHANFWDLIGSTALEPMLSGPAIVPRNTTQVHLASMRPCWPYDDHVSYQVLVGGEVLSELEGPARSGTVFERLWPAPGVTTLALTAVSDAHGRPLNRTTTRNILVTESEGTWTEWLDRDNPTGNGDSETLVDFPPSSVCNGAMPIGIRCETLGGVDWTLTGEVYTCSPTLGGVCANRDQVDSLCEDYRVKFLCP